MTEEIVSPLQDSHPKEEVLCKTCTRCKRTLGVSNFRRKGDGYGYACKECLSAYDKEYNKKNKEEVSRRRKEYEERVKDKRKEYLRAYRKKNAARILAYNNELRRRDNERIRKRDRDRRANDGGKRLEYERKYRVENKEKVDAHRDSFRKNNPWIVRECEHKRRNAMLGRPKYDDEFNTFAIREALILSDMRRDVMGGKWHLDHIEPLNSKVVCGLHNAFNIAVVPASYNIRKHNKQVDKRWFMYC